MAVVEKEKQNTSKQQVDESKVTKLQNQSLKQQQQLQKTQSLEDAFNRMYENELWDRSSKQQHNMHNDTSIANKLQSHKPNQTTIPHLRV